MARKILLADDSVTAQNMGRRILSDAGYDVITVNNGSAALKKIAEQRPDLIILDVYMPGYGGLEVCQRVRETPDTARIPVLLTVGKLEPFKADEVRRVRADAFIVKPFEASELLTALTKLEDRIVPQAAPRKPGRLPRPGDASDDFVPRDFGDTEKGWKNRLAIPPPHGHKPDEVEQNAGDRREEIAPSIAIPATILTGIAPEEIEAIAAAAVALGTESMQAAQHEPVDSHVPDEPAIAANTEYTVNAEAIAETPSFASVPEVLPPAESTPSVEMPATMVQGEVSGSEVGRADIPATTESFPELGLAASVSEPEPTAVQPSATSSETSGDAEVTAALASLAPAHGNGEHSYESLITLAAAGAQYSGPRWIAEQVALSENESAMILEHEMQKAYAAFAAAAGDRVSGLDSQAQAVATAEIPASSSTPAVGFVESAETKPEESQSWGVGEVLEMKAEAAFAAVASASVSSTEAVSVEPVAVETSPGASIPAEAFPAEPAPAEPLHFESVMVPHELSPQETAQQEVSASPQESAPSAEQRAPERETELASAWANWKQVRESASDSAAATETVASSENTSVQQSTSTSSDQTQPDVSDTAADDDTAISNIVDSVLADLKPKLMKEIARKMKKEKKQT